MTRDREEQLSQLLRLAAEALDMPDVLYLEAVRQYEEVGEWLGALTSPLQDNSPAIYPQGSAILGTINAPLLATDEYDIDLVCLLQLVRQSISQKELKKRVGDRLRQNEGYRKVLAEGRRCWTLNFKGRFHMDVLPAIPDDEGRRESILITDKELTRWQHSDPKGYAAWFWERMRVVFEEEKRALAKAMQADIEDVPDWKIKTPLQRSVQLLKRHRDVHFQSDHDDKPVSIIISTLAARAYTGQVDLYDALVQIVCEMPNFIENRNGVYWVANPVNDAENFADKWKHHPQRRDKCFAWLKKVHADLITALEKRGISEITATLGASFGQSVMVKAAKGLGDAVYQQRRDGKLRMAAGTGVLSSVGITSVRSHTFHGGVDETKSD
jgi:hypothetical protein